MDSVYLCLQWIMGPDHTSQLNDDETASLFNFIGEGKFSRQV